MTRDLNIDKELRLMCVLAHPDDESLGMGGTLAKYASEGVETYLLTATRGERGRYGNGGEFPGFDAVGRMREAELLAAARELGIREVSFLDYRDGDLDQANPSEAVARIGTHLLRIRPQVVVTFGPEGAYGHPDHIAISQFTAAAVVWAADHGSRVPNEDLALSPPHRVSKLYYISWTRDKWAAYQAAFRDLKTTVDGVERRVAPWPDWAVTTRIDTQFHWPAVWKAVCCHKTQMAIFGQLEHLSEEHHKAVWGLQEFYRVFSLVNGGRRQEIDLFEGLR
jgi:LmbE family N-acetylglucosaminyl deacetylase